MSNLIELIFLFLVLILTELSIIYFIAQKRENSPILLKYIIMLLLGVSVIIFIINSLPIITSVSGPEVSSENLILSNVPIFLLCFSISISNIEYLFYLFFPCPYCEIDDRYNPTKFRYNIKKK